MSTDTLLDTPPRGFPAIAGADVSQRAFALQRGFNELFGLYGHAADAPRPGETDEAYMRRGLDSAKRYSSTWNRVDFNHRGVTAETLPIAYQQVVRDGIATFKRSGPGTGELREAVQVDDAGRKIRTFFGDPEFCWRPFKDPVRRLVSGWNTALGKGANAPGAVKPIGTLMSDGSMRRV